MGKRNSRREFFKRSGLIGLGIVSTNFMSYRNIKATDKKFKLNLALASYTTRSLSLEETIDITKRLDLKYLAIKDKFHLPVSSDISELKEKSKMIREHGIDFFGGGVHYMNSREEIDRVFEYAKNTGIRVIVGVVKPEDLEYANKKIIENNIKIAIHNHGPEDEIYPSPESAYNLIKNLDSRFGLCIDIGHTVRSGFDPAKDIIRFGDRLHDVHLKDLESDGRDAKVIEIGRGIIDVISVIKALKLINYQYTTSFEHEKDGEDPVLGLAESVGYIKGISEII